MDQAASCTRVMRAHVPDESGQFAGDAHDSHVPVLAVCGEFSEAAAQSQLRVPGAVDDGSGQAFVSDLDDAADLGGEAVGPRRFDQDLACVAVAGLGDAASASGSDFSSKRAR